MQVEIRDSRAAQVIAPDVELETVATGFEFTEGPIWHPYEKHLTFSDIIASTMYRWDYASGLRIFRKPSHMANGNTYDREGRILTCEHATSRVSQTDLDGTVSVLASHYDGKELNSPNDIVVKSDGSVYFSDPSFGRRARVGIPRPQDLEFQAAFCFNPVTNILTPIVRDFENPNGLCFSLDETLLFVNDSPRYHIRVFDVCSNHTVTNGRVWAEVRGDGKGVPDGMKFDGDGNLFCAGPGGIYIFDNSANCLAKVPMPESTLR